ncbi:enoyl-CoA hydratase/carnithine racemase [Halopolyspora algeriensis]|uniref:Enoyl-CoA hydratase/carnithine racemase n=1 Tax=Halopolyspora algeriensis TaxID=1500506 RepID=A0A368VXX2_9ACTN|nr:enoyl-CoA hydratase-related protein [Halopolyspora algeriensis]RCW46827.1 enoyl-CoA hydratase/carnithine racemase [Halopolyspora algeriensis]TQM47918.1 enoyl-CoA hydratase/carnithine racemase [Halopolyspora algeriensis]
MPTLHEDDGVFVLDLGDDENRFSPEWLNEVNASLDAVVAHSASGALVTTGQGKFYSNGLDLEWIMEHADQLASYRADVQKLLARVLTLPVPAVAAVQGHAFGAGAMLALAHDYRVMRADRGFFCFPEVDIDIPFTPGMAALIQGKLTPAAAVEAMTTGRRFGGVQARDRGLVDQVADEGDVVRTAAELVRPLAGKNRDTLGAIKSTMFTSAVTALRAPEPAAQP